MAMKKAAPKKAVAKKGDEPVRVGSKTTPKKKRVLTAAESRAMAKGISNSYRTEYRGEGWVEGPKGSNTYLLKRPYRESFGATKPMNDFNKSGPFAGVPKLRKALQQDLILRNSRKVPKKK